MRYEKPIVMNLNARARPAAGQGPLGCVSGPAAGQWESCGSGGSAWSCLTGGRPRGYQSCMPGDEAGLGGDCLSGTEVSYSCEAGTYGSDDPYGCNSGPTYT